MKMMFWLVVLMLGLVNQVFGQEIFVNREYGFAIEEPKNWIHANKAELDENLKKYELTDEVLARLLKQGNGSIVLAAFYKYALNSRAGLIPTIQVRVRAKGPAGFEEFKIEIIRSLTMVGQNLEEYELIEDPKELAISGVRSIAVTSKFVMKGQSGQILKVRSRTYAIPFKNYFFQVNFTDSFEKDDCSEEFDELVKTIKIGSEIDKKR